MWFSIRLQRISTRTRVLFHINENEGADAISNSYENALGPRRKSDMSPRDQLFSDESEDGHRVGNKAKHINHTHHRPLMLKARFPTSIADHQLSSIRLSLDTAVQAFAIHLAQRQSIVHFYRS